MDRSTLEVSTARRAAANRQGCERRKVAGGRLFLRLFWFEIGAEGCIAMAGIWRFLVRLLGFGPKRHRDVFEQIVAPANMVAALARVQRRAREHGASEAELARFAGAGRDRLEALRQDLIRGRYRPGSVRHLSLAKADGGSRKLTLLPLPDRIAQTAANQVLTPLLDVEFSDASFGYRPNRSLADALDHVKALRRKGLTFVLDADIEGCFDRIRHDRVIDRLERSIADRRLLRLIETWLGAFAGGGRGLPQGAPLSPLLCNVALDPLDEGLARGPGRSVRFSDDFLILCRSRREAENAETGGGTAEPAGTALQPAENEIDELRRRFLLSRPLLRPRSDAARCDARCLSGCQAAVKQIADQDGGAGSLACSGGALDDRPASALHVG